MIQLPDNSLLIGTGEGFVEEHGVNISRMSPNGRGVYHFNPGDNSFTLVSSTNPVANSDWTFVNRMASLVRDGFMYVYVATGNGLYRWKLNANNPDWTAAPSKVQAGNFQDVVVISADNIAYATTPNRVFRVGNVTGESAAVDVTNTGSLAGDEVVQIYVRDLVASTVRPRKQLCGFRRVSIGPGECVTVTIPLSRSAFELVNASYERVLESGEFEIQAGASSEDIRQTINVSL